MERFLGREPISSSLINKAVPSKKSAPSGQNLPDLSNNLSLYLSEIKAVSPLTPGEERDLSAQIHDLKIRLQDPSIQDADRKTLESQLDQTRGTFITANLGLVVFFARRYQRVGRELLDLIQDGNIGLAEAVDGYDGELGFRFSTYAETWIKHYIERGIANSGSVRIPEGRINDLYELNKVIFQLTQELGREPSQREILERSGWKKGRMQLTVAAQEASRPMVHWIVRSAMGGLQ